MHHNWRSHELCKLGIITSILYTRNLKLKEPCCPKWRKWDLNPSTFLPDAVQCDSCFNRGVYRETDPRRCTIWRDEGFFIAQEALSWAVKDKWDTSTRRMGSWALKPSHERKWHSWYQEGHGKMDQHQLHQPYREQMCPPWLWHSWTTWWNLCFRKPTLAEDI